MRSLLLVPLACALSAAALQAQSFTSLVLEGDAVPGVGTVTGVNQVTMLGHSAWIVEVKTDNPDPDLDTVAITNGLILVKEGDPVSAPLGATVKALDSYSYAGNGLIATNYTLANTGGTNDFEGVYFNQGLVVQRGTSAVAAGFSPGTTWGGFGDVQAGPAQPNGDAILLVRGYADDPAVPGTSDYFAALVAVDGQGGFQAAQVLAQEGQIPPGQSEVINTIRTGSWNGRISPAGTVFWACDLNGSDLSDACVYRWQFGTSTLVAQEGSPSPVPGRNWGDLVSPEIDANAAGDWTLKDRLDGSGATDGIIVKNGAKFVQEGDSHPDIAPFVLNELGNGPAKLTGGGQVLWFGGWDDSAPGAYREGLFLDQAMIVREGQSVIGGILLQDIDQQNDSYTITDDGQFVIFKGTLADGREGAFLWSQSGVATYCTAKVNSAGCAPLISWLGAPSASAGSGFQLTAHAIVAKQFGLFFYGKSGPNQVPIQSGWLCALPPLLRLPAASSGGTVGCSGSFSIDFNAHVALGTDPGLVAGAAVYGQFWSRDTGFPPPGNSNLTGGVWFTLGP